MVYHSYMKARLTSQPISDGYAGSIKVMIVLRIAFQPIILGLESSKS